MLRKKCYILIGDDRTGKTSFQKYVIWYLCGTDKFTKLNTNLIHQINHPESPRKLNTLFTINRSVQEKMDEYKTVKNYFECYFRDADICILSSHSHDNSIQQVIEMIDELRARYYNVDGVFFSNSLNPLTSEISKLNWDERIFIENPNSPENWENQIDNQARLFSEMVIRTSKLY